MENIISVSNLSKRFRSHRRSEKLSDAIKSLFHREFVEHWALKDVNFEIKKGEIVGLIGPNGAGKSTAIKAMCGILHPSGGEIKVMDYIPWQDRTKYVKNIGVLFGQKTPLWWDLPAIDSFYLFRDLYDVDKKVFERRKDRMIQLLNVENIVNTPVRDLSLGERMKCGVILTLLHNPPVVFLDEPTIGMDVVAKDVLHKFVKDMNKRHNSTFIITTHDMTDIEKLCKRVIIINKGTIVYDGPLSEIKKKYINKKLIDVKFDEKTVGVKLPKSCKIISKSDYEIRFEVPLNQHRIDTVVTKLLDNYDVADINISDPEIESIIAEIYKAK
jgi:ABC-2 type transport system ATP-binding protein